MVVCSQVLGLTHTDIHRQHVVCLQVVDEATHAADMHMVVRWQPHPLVAQHWIFLQVLHCTALTPSTYTGTGTKCTA